MNTAVQLIIRILEFVFAFGLLVFLHELGHYLASKLFKVEVEEFGFGFPPRIVKLFQFRETEFTLNWLPFGAFVRPKGENDPNVPGGLAAASPWARLVVLSAGSAMNLLTGVLLFTLMFGIYGEPDPSRVLISQVNENTPAAQAGLQQGDHIIKVNGQALTGGNDELPQIIAKNLDKEVTITYQRGDQTSETRLTPRGSPPEGQGPMGIIMGTAFRPITSSQWLPRSLQTVGNQVSLMITMPVRMVQGQISPEQGRVVGPVGIFGIFSQAREQDTEMATEQNQPAGINTLSLLAVLSVALGITNLLPIPALDGGRILFVLPEIILRRRVPARYENLVHLIGFTVLILLMIYVTTQDIINPIVQP